VSADAPAPTSIDGGTGAERDARDLADVAAVEVISRAGVMLMSAAAEQLGLAAEDPTRPPH